MDITTAESLQDLLSLFHIGAEIGAYLLYKYNVDDLTIALLLWFLWWSEVLAAKSRAGQAQAPGVCEKSNNLNSLGFVFLTDAERAVVSYSEITC